MDKSRKRAADVQLSSTANSAPARPNVSLRTPKVTTDPQEASSGIVDGGYERINLSGSAKADDDHYDTVGGDYGYDSVDVVTQQGRKDDLPSLATLKRASEHIYAIVPEIPSNSKDLWTLPSDDYDHIAEIPTEKV